MPNETTALTLKQKKDGFVKLFEKYSSHVMAAMPKHIAKHLTPERILQVMRLAMSRNPKLYECPPITVIGSMIQASQLGLSLDPQMNEAHLVPIYNDKTKRKECNLWQGYKAIEKLARNSGDVVTIEAECVYEKDEYKYVLGAKPILEHYPSADPDRGKIIASYAVATMRDGSKRFKWLWKHQTDVIKKASLARTYGTGPWLTDEAEMCKKTAKKRIGKDLPMSAEAQKAIALDDMADAGINQDLGALVADDWSEEGASSLDNLTNKLDPKKEVKAETKTEDNAPPMNPEPASEPNEPEPSGKEGASGEENKEPKPDEQFCSSLYATMKKEGTRAKQKNILNTIIDSAVYNADDDPAGINPLIEQGEFFKAATNIIKYRGWTA